jgi:hypothetical protein
MKNVAGVSADSARDYGRNHSGEDCMYDRKTWSRLARLKARKIYQEMQAEGLDRDDLPRKLHEVAEREEAVVQHLVAYYGVDPIDGRLLLQLALGDEAIAKAGCVELAMGRSIQQAIAVITMLSGEEYIAGRLHDRR